MSRQGEYGRRGDGCCFKVLPNQGESVLRRIVGTSIRRGCRDQMRSCADAAFDVARTRRWY